ncbi:MAG: hypothetical protein M1818_000635 [Claussenomyces sp. TS43310]|nr:MAG: hypothetical protein M1818_000635 [Claussenomyces sp. TS43310]
MHLSKAFIAAVLAALHANALPAPPHTTLLVDREAMPPVPKGCYIIPLHSTRGWPNPIVCPSRTAGIFANPFGPGPVHANTLPSPEPTEAREGFNGDVTLILDSPVRHPPHSIHHRPTHLPHSKSWHPTPVHRPGSEQPTHTILADSDAVVIPRDGDIDDDDQSENDLQIHRLFPSPMTIRDSAHYIHPRPTQHSGYWPLAHHSDSHSAHPKPTHHIMNYTRAFFPPPVHTRPVLQPGEKDSQSADPTAPMPLPSPVADRVGSTAGFWSGLFSKGSRFGSGFRWRPPHRNHRHHHHHHHHQGQDPYDQAKKEALRKAKQEAERKAEQEAKKHLKPSATPTTPPS